MIDEVAAALSAIEAEGVFATELACSSGGLDLEVAGVGMVHFPVSTNVARKLSEGSRAAPYGRRTRTVYDRRVRDSGEIAADRIQIDEPKWRRTLEPQLEAIRRRLGLSPGTKLEAVLDKMLVYGPGQFFAPHQDSERSDDMVATLVVELPSAHRGGAMVVQHHRNKEIFTGTKRDPSDLSLLAFYADCRHEVRPIESGYRITLTYHLLARSPSKERGSLRLSSMERLVESVQSYFSTAVEPRYGDAPPEQPDRLVYLLDHEYTPSSLAWNRLKNGDRLRAEALRGVAEQLGCEAHLALADVHENWSSEDGYDYDYHEDSYDEEGRDEAEGEEDDPELGELLDSDVELRHWVSPDGKRSNATVHPPEREVCFTRASVEMKPFQSEHEGYMGNYGNTVDRWYHRAAVVLWPREHNFVLRAKLDPAWAIKQLAALASAGSLAQARERADELVPFWGRSAPQETSAEFALQVLEVVLALDDGDLAFELLAPLGLHRLTPRSLQRFAELVEGYQLWWSKNLLSTWDQGAGSRTPRWLPILPQLCQALDAAGDTGKALRTWLLKREIASFETRLTEALRETTAYRDDPDRHLSTDAAVLLQAAVVLGRPEAREALVSFLVAPKTRLPAMMGGELLEKILDGQTPASPRALGLRPLYDHVVGLLHAIVDAPARSASDWSIASPAGCKCELCKELARFLSDPQRIEFRWPLASPRRRHIHNVIDGHQLPVTHTTLRTGSPQTLVLKKQRALFARDAAERKKQKRLLSLLERRQGAFRTSSSSRR